MCADDRLKTHLPPPRLLVTPRLLRFFFKFFKFFRFSILERWKKTLRHIKNRTCNDKPAQDSPLLSMSGFKDAFWKQLNKCTDTSFPSAGHHRVWWPTTLQSGQNYQVSAVRGRVAKTLMRLTRR